MAYLDKESALAVLNVAREGGFLDQLPETEEELIELAHFYVKKAREEYDAGGKMRKDPTIKAILSLRAAAIDKKNEEATKKFFEDAPSGNAFAIPGEPTFNEYEFPSDFTQIGDKEIRKMHSEQNSLLGRARWVLSQSTNKLAAATHLREDAYRKAYKAYNSELQIKEMKPTKDLIDSYVKTEDKEYKKFDSDVTSLQAEVTTFKALVDIYSGNVDRLSREWTMRTDEDRKY